VEPSENDVVFGRGKRQMSRPGNVRFRMLVQQHRKAYLSVGRTKGCKSGVVLQVLKLVKSKGMRFLEENHNPPHTFKEVSDARATYKVYRFLRVKPSHNKRSAIPLPKITTLPPTNSPKLDELLLTQQRMFYAMIVQEYGFRKAAKVTLYLPQQCRRMTTTTTTTITTTPPIPETTMSEPWIPVEKDSQDDGICEEFEETVPYGDDMENWV